MLPLKEYAPSSVSQRNNVKSIEYITMLLEKAKKAPSTQESLVLIVGAKRVVESMIEDATQLRKPFDNRLLKLDAHIDKILMRP